MDNIYTTLAKLQDVTNRTPIMESDTAGNIKNLKEEVEITDEVWQQIARRLWMAGRPR